MARILGSILVFGSSTCIFPDLWSSQIVCSCRVISYSSWGTSGKLRVFLKVSELMASCPQLSLQPGTLGRKDDSFFPQSFLYNRHLCKIKLLASKPSTISTCPLPQFHIHLATYTVNGYAICTEQTFWVIWLRSTPVLVPYLLYAIFLWESVFYSPQICICSICQ